MLDVTAVGSLPSGERTFDRLIRSRQRKRVFQRMLLPTVKACGVVNFLYLSEERLGGDPGLFYPGVQFIRDLKLPTDVFPYLEMTKLRRSCCSLSAPDRVALGEDIFTPAHSCIVLDFLIRHGIVNFENGNGYIEVASGLHRYYDFL
ncbi:hypothetical protein MMC28_006742 [Mycoblastus sanguinarius]|nr:hypothetical protein [Mycoblastus sanguinarius]